MKRILTTFLVVFCCSCAVRPKAPKAVKLEEVIFELSSESRAGEFCQVAFGGWRESGTAAPVTAIPAMRITYIRHRVTRNDKIIWDTEYVRGPASKWAQFAISGLKRTDDETEAVSLSEVGRLEWKNQTEAVMVILKNSDPLRYNADRFFWLGDLIIAWGGNPSVVSRQGFPVSVADIEEMMAAPKPLKD